MAQTQAARPVTDSAEPAVRTARASDIVAVAALDARISGLAKLPYWQDLFARYVDRPNRFFLVAEDGAGRLLGFIIGEVRAWEFGSPPCGWVFALGVDPDLRLRKIGTRLFDAMCARLAATGVDTVRTMLAHDDELNMAFFRSQGMMGARFIQLEMPLPPRRDTTE
jgi:ribosomal protein S18 acetylase RimI-like enzyme